MNINFELYKVFYEVAISKSISKGAERLMISQPAVTMSIKTLEEELGGKLFIRTPKGVTLTNEGEELFKYIKEGMTYFINGTNKFNSLKRLEEGTLNIGSTTTISENFLIKHLKEFNKKYPNIKINIENDLTNNLIKNLRNGSLDIIIVSLPNYEIKDLNINKITTLHDIFVSNKKENFKNIKELLKNEIIIQKNPSNTRINFDNYLKENNFESKIKMEVVSHNLLIKLIENGFGIGLVTEEFVKEKLDNTLFKINIKEHITERNLCYIAKKDIYPTFTVKEFIKQIKKDE